EVDAGRRHVGAQPVQGDDRQREQDLVPQVGDPEHVPQAGQHDCSPSATTTDGAGTPRVATRYASLAAERRRGATCAPTVTAQAVGAARRGRAALSGWRTGCPWRAAGD